MLLRITSALRISIALAALTFVAPSFAAGITPPDCDDVDSGIKSALAPKRKLTEIEEIKIATFNVENLYATRKKPTPEQLKEQKSEADTARIEKILAEQNADIMALQEVENIRALRELTSRPSLKDKYDAYLIEGNDARGIDIGFLVKRDAPFRIEMESNTKEVWNDPAEGGREQKLFARDLPILKIYGLEQAPKSAPLMVVVGVHLKSKIDRPGDRDSQMYRAAEIKRAADIVTALKARWPQGNGAQKEVPIVMLGDFNGDLNLGRLPSAAKGNNEFLPLYNFAKMQNTFDLGAKPVSIQDRTTHTYHPLNGATEKNQLDGILVNATAATSHIETTVVRYKDAQGNVLPIPDTFDQRGLQPSDHMMLEAQFRFSPWVKGLKGL